MQKKYNLQPSRGFTLLEILLVIALISILAGIIIVAINPAKQTADARDAKRASDVETIMNALYQYSIDNSGALPAGIPTDSLCPGSGSSEICKTGLVSCSGYVSLSDLTLGSKYLVGIPDDPTGAGSVGTGYNVVRTSDKRLIVCAPSAENTTIKITK